MEAEGNTQGTRGILHPDMVANQWKAGQESPNPSGRPKGSKNRSTVLNELKELIIEANDVSGATKSLSAEEAMIASLLRKAIEGDVAAIKEVQDTLYGKLTDKSQVEMQATVNKIERTIVDAKDESN